MKKIIFILTFIISTYSYSQQIGIKGGLMFPKIQELSGTVSPMVGLFIATKGDLYFAIEANYKNIAGANTVILIDANNMKIGTATKLYSFKYIELPLLIGAKAAGTKIIPFVNLGVIPAFLISSQYDHKSISGANGFNLAACISPGLMMSDKVSLEARVTKSFTGIYTNNNFNYLSFSFILGYRF